jgi:hypothetical protein
LQVEPLRLASPLGLEVGILAHKVEQVPVAAHFKLHEVANFSIAFNNDRSLFLVGVNLNDIWVAAQFLRNFKFSLTIDHLGHRPMRLKHLHALEFARSVIASR